MPDQQNKIGLLFNDGNGNFGALSNIILQSGVSWVASGDFNSDGDIDIAAAGFNTNVVSIVLGNGNGSFGTPPNFPVGNALLNVLAADFNNDTNLDLVVGGGLVYTLLGNGDGSFGAAITNITNGARYSLTSGHLNSDGYRDLIAIDGLGGSLRLLFGNGNGTFLIPTSSPPPFRPWSATSMATGIPTSPCQSLMP